MCLPFPSRVFFTLAFASISVGGVVIRSSTGFAAILARVDVCRASVGRAISSLVFVFTFAPSLTYLERVNLHPVIICTRSISR